MTINSLKSTSLIHTLRFVIFVWIISQGDSVILIHRLSYFGACEASQ